MRACPAGDRPARRARLSASLRGAHAVGGAGSSSVFIAAEHTGFFDWAGPWGVGYDPYMQCYAPFVGWCPYGAYDYYGAYRPYYGGGGYVTTLPPVGPANPIAPAPQGHGQAVNGYGYTQVTPREAVAQSGGDGHSDRGSSSTSGVRSAGRRAVQALLPAGIQWRRRQRCDRCPVDSSHI
jgi:hypothetical protein